MSLIRNPEPHKYNGVLVDDDGWVTGFARAGQAETSYHFVGPQVAAHAAFAGVKDGEYAESTWGCYLPLIAANPHGIRAFKVDGIQFLDIGTVADHVRTSEHGCRGRRLDGVDRRPQRAHRPVGARHAIDRVGRRDDRRRRGAGRLRGDRRRDDPAGGVIFATAPSWQVRMAC